jgi:pilus assembly protein CpaF
LVGRFSIRRVAAPDLVPVEDAVTAVDIAPPAPAAPPPEPANPLLSEKLLDAKVRLHRRLIEEINLSALEKLPVEEIRRHVQEMVSQYVLAERLALNTQELNDFVSEILDEMRGLGPLEPLLKDHAINDILINGHECVYVERRGILEPTGVRFKDEAHLLRIINKIVSAVGRRVDEAQPMCDARLLDGSRVNVAVRPVAIDGPLVSIRKFSKKPFNLNKLVEIGALRPQMAELLAKAVTARVTTIISGGTGSGKTTLLNVLSNYIPDDERIVTVEDAAELQLSQPNLVSLEARPANMEGKGAIHIRDLVKNCLRMRPDRIVIGECRGGEAFDMLQAMNTGHDGSMTTIHANNVQDAILRLELLIGMSGLDLSASVLHRQIAAGIQLVVHVARLCGGVRKVVGIAEVVGVEGHGVKLQELFSFQQTGVDSGGAAVGQFLRPGQSAACLNRLRAAGFSESFGFASKSDA